jgi:hypothetical protein
METINFYANIFIQAPFSEKTVSDGISVAFCRNYTAIAPLPIGHKCPIHTTCHQQKTPKPHALPHNIGCAKNGIHFAKSGTLGELGRAFSHVVFGSHRQDASVAVPGTVLRELCLILGGGCATIGDAKEVAMLPQKGKTDKMAFIFADDMEENQ